MAWSSQTGHVTGPVSLPLFKLSFCTTVGLRSNLVWTHLPQRDNLFAVFDYITRSNVEGFITQKRTLKLVRGGEVLENVELDSLTLQARLDEDRNRSQLLEDADRYVIILVKRPLLAMRYQLPNGQIRRLQLNFSPESGYDTALNALQGLNLPIRDKNPPVIQRTPDPRRSFQPYQHMLPPPQPVGLLPSPEFTYRPNTSNGFDCTPSSSAPVTYTERPYSAPDPISFSQMLPPKRELPPGMRLLVNQSRLDTEAPVQTAQAPEPKQSSAKPPAKRKAQAKPTKPKAPRKNSTLEAQRILIEKCNTTHDTSAESGIATSLEVQTSTAAPRKKAPAQISKPQTVAAESNSVLLSSSLDPLAKDPGLPDLQAPRTIGPVELAIKQGLEAAAPARSSTAETNPAEPTASTTEGQRQPLLLRPGRQAMAEITSNTSNPNPAPPTPATTTPSGASAESRPRPNIEEISPSEFMSSLDTFVREYQHVPAPRAQPTAAEDLAAYAAQPDEVRQTVIKDLILECFGDENFVKLVEDVDAEWRRIGLGF